ncbi:hypothetical protein [Perlabentimonas gracilis]|uniref:hypothetical protein n=1 Tax=Perlabentimonas gracilis TaxID=2715279 RepID=UPI00140C6ABC|nr:hypothetical protein [Perlabentimonas gracilis]NHB69613.1 hypothetical protein [Perlabentimonas gracilis]
MDNNLSKLAKKTQDLTTQAYTEYKPLVEDIITNKRINQKEIECLLSLMLDFCSDDKVLSLYKTLCRYYLDINPEAAADYIRYYSEMWDSDED